MKIDIRVNGESMTIALEGRLDTMTAPELEKTLSNYNLVGLSEIVLDLEKMEYISSAGLRVLLKAYRGMKMGGVLKVINTNDITRKVFEVTGFDNIFSIE